MHLVLLVYTAVKAATCRMIDPPQLTMIESVTFDSLIIACRKLTREALAQKGPGKEAKGWKYRLYTM